MMSKWAVPGLSSPTPAGFKQHFQIHLLTTHTHTHRLSSLHLQPDVVLQHPTVRFPSLERPSDRLCGFILVLNSWSREKIWFWEGRRDETQHGQMCWWNTWTCSDLIKAALLPFDCVKSTYRVDHSSQQCRACALLRPLRLQVWRPRCLNLKKDQLHVGVGWIWPES